MSVYDDETVAGLLNEEEENSTFDPDFGDVYEPEDPPIDVKLVAKIDTCKRIKTSTGARNQFMVSYSFPDFPKATSVWDYLIEPIEKPVTLSSGAIVKADTTEMKNRFRYAIKSWFSCFALPKGKPEDYRIVAGSCPFVEENFPGNTGTITLKKEIDKQGVTRIKVKTYWPKETVKPKESEPAKKGKGK